MPDPSDKPKKPRGKPFVKGEDPRRANTAEKPPPPPRVEVEGSGLLADYRFVWENDKAHDDTPQRRTLRKMLDDDPRGFVKDLKELEKAELSGKAAGEKAPGACGVPSPADPQPADLGADRCLELIDQLLGETP
jgi:hypothetical protein